MGLLDYMGDSQPPEKKMTEKEQEESDAFWKKEKELADAAQLPGESLPVNRELIRQLVLRQITPEQEKTVFLLIAGYKAWKTAFLEEQLLAINADKN